MVHITNLQYGQDHGGASQFTRENPRLLPLNFASIRHIFGPYSKFSNIPKGQSLIILRNFKILILEF